MKPFMGNPCGHPHCMFEDCSQCPAFKPRLFHCIPVPRWLGNWLFRIEERMFYKKCIKTDDWDFDGWDGDF